MSHFKIFPLALISTVLLCTSLSIAKTGSGFRSNDYNFSARANARETKRWTLSEWLEQKDRAKMMDLWLAFNSPSPYELMLGVGYLSYTTHVDSPLSEESHNSIDGEFAAYAQNFGLSVEYGNNTAEKFNDLSGIFHLRLFGNSIQDSFLNLDYGLRTRTSSAVSPETRLAQQFGQVSLQIYLRKMFGIDGHYRYFLPVTHETLGQVKGDEVEGGAFIDFGPIRVYGTYFQEKTRTTAPAATTEVVTERKGIRSGVKFFF